MRGLFRSRAEFGDPGALRGVSAPENVSVNGKETDWSYEEVGGKLMVRLAEDTGEVKVEANLQIGR